MATKQWMEGNAVLCSQRRCSRRPGQRSGGAGRLLLRRVSTAALWLALLLTASTATCQAQGNVWAWGFNYFGQLGNDSPTTSSPYGIATPAIVLGSGGSGTTLLSITAIAEGSGDGTGSSYAVDANGHVWAWGDNNYGQLGNNSTTNSPIPVEVVSTTGSGTLSGDKSHLIPVISNLDQACLI